jgi:hypothetical protein
MNTKLKKIITIYAFIAIVVIAIVVFLNWHFSFRDVSFVLSEGVTGVTIREVTTTTETMATSDIITFNENRTIRLRPGLYQVVPIGDVIDATPFSFGVDYAMTVTVTPPYSKEYLNNLLVEELPAIRQVLLNSIDRVTENNIIHESMFIRGEWYGAVMRFSDATGERADYYRVILHKSEGSWGVATNPRIVLSYSLYPNVPKTIIDSVNRHGLEQL